MTNPGTHGKLVHRAGVLLVVILEGVSIPGRAHAGWLVKLHDVPKFIVDRKPDLAASILVGEVAGIALASSLHHDYLSNLLASLLDLVGSWDLLV